MTPRVRHCVECPKCLTRYLVGFSPYRNGSYLMPLSAGFSEEWTLYCSCGRPPISSRWNWNELKLYAVSNQAHDRGFGHTRRLCRFARSRGFRARAQPRYKYRQTLEVLYRTRPTRLPESTCHPTTGASDTAFLDSFGVAGISLHPLV